MPDDNELWAAPEQRPERPAGQPLTEGAWPTSSGSSPGTVPPAPGAGPGTGWEPTQPVQRPTAPPPAPAYPAYPGAAPAPLAAPNPPAVAPTARAAPPPPPAAPGPGTPTAAYPLAAPSRDDRDRPRGRVAGWVWPVIAVMSLVLGVGGGVVGASLLGNDRNSGGILKVERRTAAPLPADNGSVAAVAGKLVPSTVQIVAEYQGKDRGATGSGWVLDRQGHIVTNNHVVAEAAKDDGNIEVVDTDGNRTKATVVGRSPVYDVAVLQADVAKKLKPVKLGSSSQMRVGETVVAIGSPLGLSSTVTSGIVSAVDRPVSTGDSADDQSYINAVQTDAAINPGNSGGPLVNLQGEVVGMNSAIASLGSASGEGGNIGVGFAIPIEQIEVTVNQILTSGYAEYPYIGASVGGSADVDGAQIRDVTQGDPADDAGLRAGDLVTRVDDKPVATSVDLVVAIRSHQSGDELDLTVKRGSDTRSVKITLDSRRDNG